MGLREPLEALEARAAITVASLRRQTQRGDAAGFPEREKNSELLGVYETFSFFDLSHNLCSCSDTSGTKDSEQRCGDRC